MTRCPHDVDPRACATCSPTEPDPYVSRPFPAAYAGTCTTCRRPIEPGDQIEAYELGYVHARSCR